MENTIKLEPVIKRYGTCFQLVVASAAVFLSSVYAFTQDQQLQFQLPIDCEIGKTCFLQSYADLDSGPGVLDPFCGKATYDGHKGTDIRLKSSTDILLNVPVLAAADGIVRGARNNMADKLVHSQTDKLAIQNKECGNGVVIAHRNGYESQYCHMRRGSVTVNRGDVVRAGDTIGHVGLSGLTQFPHIHFTLRKNGKWLDALSGLFPENACSSEGVKQGFFTKDVQKLLSGEPTQVLDIGISGEIIRHEVLVETGGPQSAKSDDEAIVGWVWLINLQQGDRVAMQLDGPDGEVASNITKPIDRHKAAWSGFVGKNKKPKPGQYIYSMKVLRGEKVVREATKTVVID